MKKATFKRTTALFLALITVLGCFAAFPAFATGDDPAVVTSQNNGKSDTSVSDKSISDVKELLNAISYEEYSEKYESVPRATSEIVIDGTAYNVEKTNAAVGVTEEYPADDGSKVKSLFVPGTGTVVWDVNIPEDAKYSIVIEYYPVEAKSVSIQRIFRINGKVPFSEARYITISKVWKNLYEDVDPDTGRKFRLDIDRNELRPSITQAPEWRTFELKDRDGFYSSSFEFFFEKGENEISLEAVSEPMAIKSISLVPHVDTPSYEEVKKSYETKGYKPADKDSKVFIEAEEPVAISSQTVYPVEDVSSAITSPSDSSRTLLNTIGGEKWQTAGQWVQYTFTPEKSGLYNIVTRYKQNVNDGLYSSRTLYIYGGEYNGVPFTEATAVRFVRLADGGSRRRQHDV